MENYDQKVCGRVLPSQLDFQHKDITVVIKSLSQKHRNSNLSFYILSVGAMMLLSCGNNTEQAKKTSHIDTTISVIETSERITGEMELTNTCESRPKPSTQLPLEEDVTGVMIIEEENIQGEIDVEHNNPFIHPEKMPEFPGGIDSLYSFLFQNLIYPKEDKKSKIEGKVYARIIINKTGKISNEIEILRSPSENMSNEVIRVIKIMPDWIPGENNGDKVDVQFIIPVKFEL